MSDADGDVVRCRWAESALEECGEVCKNIPVTLDEVSYFLFSIRIIVSTYPR